MTTVVSSSTHPSKPTGRTPPPRPPPPRKVSSEQGSKTLKDSHVADRTGCSEPAATSEPPPKPPRTYQFSLRQKSATLPSSLRDKVGVDMTEVLQRYASTSTSDDDLDSLPSEGGARPMDGKRWMHTCAVQLQLGFVLTRLLAATPTHARTHTHTHTQLCLTKRRTQVMLLTSLRTTRTPVLLKTRTRFQVSVHSKVKVWIMSVCLCMRVCTCASFAHYHLHTSKAYAQLSVKSKWPLQGDSVAVKSTINRHTIHP